ncbi:MAG TPA: hypothetical protein VFU49_13420 [Ktedonobacteraceae bacterium]|nr:hypothetical protein [Ktedonobacteraceae bacterium]
MFRRATRASARPPPIAANPLAPTVPPKSSPIPAKNRTGPVMAAMIVGARGGAGWDAGASRLPSSLRLGEGRAMNWTS